MRRRPRWTARVTARAVFSVAIAVVLVVSPWMPIHVPEPGARLGTAPAAAQSPPDDCPSDSSDLLYITEATCYGLAGNCPSDPADTRMWAKDVNNPSLCVLSDEPCPESPLQVSGQAVRYMQYSIEFLDFCEDTIWESESAQVYNDCAYIQPNTNPPSPPEVLSGFARMLDAVPGDRSCRAIVPARCASGLHRVSSDECRQYERRTWECPVNAISRNQFNTCYQPPPAQTGSHPACQTGAPQFAIADCATYVGSDFARTPAAIDCTAYDTGTAASQMTAHSNDYWCAYNRSWLNVDCHGSTPPCVNLNAMCIKRASTTGGCDAIANTMRCRTLQADFLNRTLSAEDVYRERCVPCTVLPFSPVPTDCPVEHSATPSVSTLNHHQNAHRVKDDFYSGSSDCTSVNNGGDLVSGSNCDTTLACADPPRGRLEWNTTHSSSVAIVNSPIIVHVLDLPLNSTTYRHQRIINRTVYLYERQYYAYPEGTNSTVQSWPEIAASAKESSVRDLMERPRNSGECILRSLPSVRLIVEELWPDDDGAEILHLFGPRALDWWNAMSQQDQNALSAARGFILLDGLTSVERTAERERRKSLLQQEIDCNFGTELWCRWVPRRAGYFRLIGAGAWHLSKYQSGGWKSSWSINHDTNFLQNEVSAVDGACTTTDKFARGRDRDCIFEDLTLMNATPADVGLLNDLSGFLPVGNDDFPYTAAAGSAFRCPPRDLRASCGGTSDSVSYTTTAPVGVAVHEARVVTHQASPPGP